MSLFTSFLSQTTDRVNSIRQNIFTSETDGDTEDDTHICRVLRSYYTEKGRPFPGWLPPDPKAPAPVQPVYNSTVGAGYGGFNQSSGSVGSGGSLSSLWDQPAGNAPPPQPQSLRAGRAGVRGGRDPFNRLQSKSVEPAIQARPLPSQRAGSFQTVPGGRSDNIAAPPAGAGSASDKLKARLWGGRSSPSPAPYPTDNDNYGAPPGGGYRPGNPNGPRNGLPSNPRMR